MATVNYRGKTISDPQIKKVLNNIARHVGSVYITSGDRYHVPKGGSQTSLHLLKQAADFGIAGMSLETGFKKLMSKHAIIFDRNARYEIIWHGEYTKTGGPHLHIGRYPTGRGLLFKTEGTTKTQKGYSIWV